MDIRAKYLIYDHRDTLTDKSDRVNHQIELHHPYVNQRSQWNTSLTFPEMKTDNGRLMEENQFPVTFSISQQYKYIHRLYHITHAYPTTHFVVVLAIVSVVMYMFSFCVTRKQASKQARQQERKKEREKERIRQTIVVRENWKETCLIVICDGWRRIIFGCRWRLIIIGCRWRRIFIGCRLRLIIIMCHAISRHSDDINLRTVRICYRHLNGIQCRSLRQIDRFRSPIVIWPHLLTWEYAADINYSLYPTAYSTVSVLDSFLFCASALQVLGHIMTRTCSWVCL